MRNSVYPQFIAFSLCLLSSFPVFPADASQGAALADKCAGCHGAKGISSDPQWPNLAAQKPGYIVKQLKAFKSGERANPIMQSMAGSLSPADMENLAAYFASLPPGKAGSDANLAKAGQEKAAMCMGCHGNNGLGAGQTPRLAGQHPDYLIKQLKNFKNGSRNNSTMKAMSSNLSEDDMAQITAFFASVQ